ncbi:MAG: hypothetical protein AB7S41_06455 [Parvibaculaceae bacterium]
MAEHGATPAHMGDMQAHRHTYQGFIRGAVAIAIHCFYILVALCSFAFATRWPVFLGFAGILIGGLLIAIDLRSGAKSFLLSLGGLVLFALITAVNVS